MIWDLRRTTSATWSSLGIQKIWSTLSIKSIWAPPFPIYKIKGPSLMKAEICRLWLNSLLGIRLRTSQKSLNLWKIIKLLSLGIFWTASSSDGDGALKCYEGGRMCVFLTICFLCRLAMATTSVPGPLCLAPFCGVAWSLLKPCMFWRCFLSFSFSASADILGFCLSCGSLLLFIHGQLYVPDCLPKFLLPRSGSLIFFDSLFAILCGGC